MALELQCCEKREQHVKNGNNAWVEEVYVKTGEIVTIAGTSYPSGQVPEGMPERPLIVHGAALTFGVDRELWENWLEQNKNTAMVKNGMVFAHSSQDHVRGMAKESKGSLSGLDALNPKGDRRMPKKLANKVGSVTVGEGAGAEVALEAAE